MGRKEVLKMRRGCEASSPLVALGQFKEKRSLHGPCRDHRLLLGSEYDPGCTLHGGSKDRSSIVLQVAEPTAIARGTDGAERHVELGHRAALLATYEVIHRPADLEHVVDPRWQHMLPCERPSTAEHAAPRHSTGRRHSVRPHSGSACRLAVDPGSVRPNKPLVSDDGAHSSRRRAVDARGSDDRTGIGRRRCYTPRRPGLAVYFRGPPLLDPTRGPCPSQNGLEGLAP